MAPKRRASSEALPASKERRSGSEPRERLAGTLTSLNEQFASWVAFNKDSSAHLLWIDGVRDYVHHATKVLGECKAFLPPENVSALQQAVSDSTSADGRCDNQLIKTKSEGADKEDRAVDFVRRVGALNRQFAKWVAISKETSLRMWWLEAARDYLKHASKLLTDFSDVFSEEPDSKAVFGAVGVAASKLSESEMECRAPSFGSLPGTAPVGFGAFGTPGPNAGLGLAGLFGAHASQPATSGKGNAPATGFLAPAAASASTGVASNTFIFGSLPTAGVSTGTAAGASTAVTPNAHSGGFGGFGVTVPSSSAPAAAQAAVSTKDAPASTTVATGFVFPPIVATSVASKDATTRTADEGTSGSSKAAAGDKSEPANTAAGSKAFGFSLPGPTASAPVLIKADTAGDDEVTAAQPLKAFTTANFTASATTAAAPKDATASAAEVGTVRDIKGLVDDRLVAAAAAAGSAAAAAATGVPSTTSVTAAASSGLPKFGTLQKTESPAAASATGEPAQPTTMSFGVGSTDHTRVPASNLFVFGAPSMASSSAAAATSTTPATTSSFIFGTAPAQTAAASSASAGAANLAGAVFGSGAVLGGSTAPSFGAAVKDTAGVGTGTTTISSATTAAAAFGSAASSSSAPLGSFFGAAAPAGGSGTAPALGGFSFGGSGTSFGVNPNPAAAAASAEEADDNEPEPEPDEYAKEPGGVKPDETVDVLFREKARLQVPLKGPDGKLSGWQSLGVGTLSIRMAKGDKSKPFVALYMDNGACLYRAYLYKTMKLVVSDKQKSVAFSAVWGLKDAVPAMNPALFQLKAGKNREFEKVVMKLQEEMPE